MGGARLVNPVNDGSHRAVACARRSVQIQSREHLIEQHRILAGPCVDQRLEQFLVVEHIVGVQVEGDVSLALERPT